MLQIPASGRCQCGNCVYSLIALPYVTYSCHCAECQKLTSSAFLSCMQVPAESVQLENGSPVSRQRIADSGNTVVTWFCPNCSSTLFAENSIRTRVRTIHIGSLEHPERVEVNAHIWVKRKLPWVNLPETHRTFDEAADWTEDYARDPTRYHPQ